MRYGFLLYSFFLFFFTKSKYTYCKSLQVLDDGDESDEDSGAEDDSESEAVILSPESNAISAKVPLKLAVAFFKKPNNKKALNT